MSTKRIRTCIACGAKEGKMSLQRIVRTAEGAAFDPTGRMPGRGAYVCNVACLEKAQHKGGLSRALKAKIDNEIYEHIHSAMNTALNEQ